jgi:hypothetical protein
MMVMCACGRYVVRARKESTGKIDLFDPWPKGGFIMSRGAALEPLARHVSAMKGGESRYRLHQCKPAKSETKEKRP